MKRILTIFFFLSFLTIVSYGRERTYQLSSHILDINAGKPAPGVRITLSRLEGDNVWRQIDEKLTDANGRVRDFLEQDGSGNTGIYRLTYHVGPYFKSRGEESFYPFVEVVFEIKDDSHYHVPITLSPYGYSTYRGN